MMNSSEEKSLPQKISEDIISLILEENLQPGDKLPNETILSERLNAGRSSVREAMKLLASRNIVTIRQGSGTYIASSPGMVEDPLGFTFIGNKQKLIHDLLEVRFLLEPSIAAMAATNAEEKDIKKITAGDKLPNETILSERLNAGRSSVREAMKLLASRNIVTIRQGSGTYIASSPGMVEDPLGFTFIGNKQKLIHDLLEVRFLLEPSIAAMAATNAEEKDIKKITALCDEVEVLLNNHEDHTQKDIEFHAAIALSSKNVVVPRLIPVINSSIPLFVESTGNTLHKETIETHREIADAIAAHDPLRAQDAMYLHLVYNRKRIHLAMK